MSLAVDVLVVIFVASMFAAGFIVAMRDFDQLRAHVDHEEQLDRIWDDEGVAA